MLYRALCCVFVILMSLTSCVKFRQESKEIPKTNSPTFTLIFDKKFSSPEQELILDAFRVWEQDTHGVVKFVRAPYTVDTSIEEIQPLNECTYDVYIVVINSREETVQKLDKRDKAKTLGFTTSTCSKRLVAFVTDRFRDSKIYHQVAVHEAGHLVGLDHIPVPHESVMFPSVDDGISCPSSLDMKQLCKLYNCDWQKMQYCD